MGGEMQRQTEIFGWCGLRLVCVSFSGQREVGETLKANSKFMKYVWDESFCCDISSVWRERFEKREVFLIVYVCITF